MTGEAPPEMPRDRSARIAAAGIVLLAVAAYANSLAGAFVLDDRSSIVESESIRALGRGALAGETATTVGRPVLNATFALNYAACGLDVRGWHLVNLAIHAVAGVLLFGVARRTLASPRVTERVRVAATAIAFAIAAVWTVHPLQTESVTYVCQRAESLAGLLFLATVWCAIRGRGSATVVACALGVATKETVATAPLIVLLHDRTFVSGSFGEAIRRRRGMYAGLAATWALLAGLVASSQGRRGSAGFGEGMSAWEYAATQPGVLLDYLRLSVWPHPLVLDRGAHVARTAAEIVPGAIVVVALLAATAWALVRRPALGFLGAWFFVILAPTSSVVPLVTQTAAEHRMYLPLAAVVALGVLAAHAFVASRGARAALLAAALGVLVWRTHLRNAMYEDPVELWRDNVARTPDNLRAHMNLGIATATAGDVPGGVRHLDDAVALDPSNSYARLLRGNLLQKAGRIDEAIADYTAAARTPHRARQALTNRAVLYGRLGRTTEAERDLVRVLAEDPDYEPALRARDNLHFQD